MIGASVAQSWELSPREQQQVERGELVIHAESIGDGHIKEVQGLLKIKASPMHVFTLITDYEHLPEFMPNLDKVEVLTRDKNGAQVDYYLDLPFGVKKRYRLQLNYDTTSPDLRMAWHSIPWQGVPEGETVKNTVGYWQLTAIKNNETLLHYYTKTDPGHVPLGLGWLIDYLTKKTVAKLLQNTKKRVEKQAKSQPNQKP